MATNMQMQIINEFVIEFISEHGSKVADDTIMEEWKSDENQKTLDSLLKKMNKSKKSKDPNRPKRPKSSYLFFCEAEREKVKATLDEDAKGADVMTALGAAWAVKKESKKKADTADLTQYAKLAVADKDRYETEMADYVPPSDSALTELKKKRKGSKKKDKDAPKRPKSSYLFFCEAEREQVKATLDEDAKGADVMTALGAAWAELKESKKKESISKMKKYAEQAVADKERYTEEMETYVPPSESDDEKPTKKGKSPPEDKMEVDNSSEEELIEEEEEEVKKVKAAPKKAKAAPKKAKAAPKKASKITGFDVFAKSNRELVVEHNPDATDEQITEALQQMWDQIDEDDREEWDPKNATK
jgi:hypothetical protein